MPTTMIVDDEEDIRFLLRSAIDSVDRGLEVVGEAADGMAAIDEWRRTRPDVVILDERMPRLDGIETAKRMLRELPTQRIILFSAFLTSELQQRASDVGIRLCLSKDQLFEVPGAVRNIAT